MLQWAKSFEILPLEFVKLCCLTLEDGTDRLSQNASSKLHAP